MNIDWGAIVGKVPEIAMVLVVVWFVLQFTKDARAQSANIMEGWKGFLHAQNQHWQEYFKLRDETYIAAINSIRDRQDDELRRLSSDIKAQGALLIELTGELSKQNGKFDEIINYLDKLIRYNEKLIKAEVDKPRRSSRGSG